MLFLLDGIVFIGGYEFICEDGRERKLATILIISGRKERCAWCGNWGGFVGVFPQGWKVESLSGYKSADADQNTRGIL